MYNIEEREKTGRPVAHFTAKTQQNQQVQRIYFFSPGGGHV